MVSELGYIHARRLPSILERPITCQPLSNRDRATSSHPRGRRFRSGLIHIGAFEQQTLLTTPRMA